VVRRDHTSWYRWLALVIRGWLLVVDERARCLATVWAVVLGFSEEESMVGWLAGG